MVEELDYDLVNVVFEGQEEDYSYYFEQDKVVLQIRGLAEDLDRIQREDIVLNMDVTGMGPGVHPARFMVLLRDGFELVGQSPVMIVVEDLNEEPDESIGAEDSESESDNGGSDASKETE